MIPDVRVTSQYDDDQFTELVESVRNRGILQAIMVSRLGDQYVLEDGFRRLAAAKEAGLITVPAKIEDDTLPQIMLKNLMTARQRGRSNPAEEAKVVALLIEEEGFTELEVAEQTGISRRQVRELLDVAHLPPEVLTLISDRSLKISHALELLKLRTPEDRISVASDAARWGYTVYQVQERVRQLLQPEAPLVPGGFLYQADGVPVRVPILCALCARDIGVDKSYLWLDADCIRCVSEACHLLKSQGACRIPPPTAPAEAWDLDDNFQWQRVS